MYCIHSISQPRHQLKTLIPFSESIDNHSPQCKATSTSLWHADPWQICISVDNIDMLARHVLEQVLTIWRTTSDIHVVDEHGH